MSLGNTKMQDILKEYDQIREKNRDILLKRRAEVEVKAPLYFDYHRQIISLCMQHTNASLYPEAASSTTSADYKDTLSALRAAKARALKDAGFPADYLEPVYDCPVCKDTGFLATTQCDCLKQRIIRAL